ncbi:hypothetical protein [Kitasatospora terrestris]|uniref:Uncharacterized protein n=1 Tax=Kitasatospora terrestris TaxID=258051 RepID=A0ABP9DG96_9ACTN
MILAQDPAFHLHAGRSLCGFDAPDSCEGHEQRVDEVATHHFAEGGVKVPETVEWSRVRCTGYSFIKVDGTRVDHCTVARRAGECAS